MVSSNLPDLLLGLEEAVLSAARTTELNVPKPEDMFVSSMTF